MKFKKVLSSILTMSLCFTALATLGISEKANAATVNSIPNTSRSIKNYDNNFLSVTGYASVNNAVNDRSRYVGTSYYRTVNNEREFLDAVLNAQSGKVKVIEIKKNLNLGWKELNLNSNEKSKYNFVSKYEDPTNGYTNPTLESAGVSKLNITNTNGLTIFFTNGSTIKHVEIKLQASANDIVIRNLKFDDMWQFDDSGKHKEVGWTFIKVNGAKNVWIDHCKFTNAADGNVDIENGSYGLTFSWCEFGAETTENPSSDSAIYKSVNFMEQKYKNNQLKSDSMYYKMRKGGASVKSNPPQNPFSFNYNYNEKLPYSYNVVPLNKVESVLNKYSGAGKVSMNSTDWLKTNYNSSSSSSGTSTSGIVDGGIYYIKNLNSQLYLDVVNGVDANGSNIRQWTGNGYDAQRFKVVSTSDGYYKLVSQTGSKKRVVDVNGNKATNGQNISLFDDRGTDNQKFKLIDNGNGVYQIATKVSGNKSLVEVKNASRTVGENVQQWENNSNNCQKWVFELAK